jgi:MarR family transcriptional regulator, transcriptional regulator for hemolysin
MRPQQPPIGLLLVQTAKVVRRAFEEALAEVGGSLPTWLVLLTLMHDDHRTQADLAAAIGIQGPTLTHHLNAMESEGLLTRVRNPENRRVHLVELTSEGSEKFQQLRQAAMAFDRRLRNGLSAGQLETLRGLMGQLASNAGGSFSDVPFCKDNAS